MLFAKRVSKLIAANWKTALFFEFVFKAVLVAIILPLCKGFFGFALYLSGNTYLTQNTIGGFFASPVTWIVIVLIVLTIAFALLFELCALALLFRSSQVGEPLGFSTLCYLSLMQLRRISRRWNLLFIPFILIFALVSNIGLIAGSLAFSTATSSIVTFFSSHVGLLVLFILLFIVFAAITCIFGLSLFSFTLAGKGFLDACMASLRLIKGSIFRFVARLAVWNVLLAACTLILALLLQLFARYLLPFIFTVLSLPASAVAMQITILCIILAIFYSCLVVTITYALVSQTYFDILKRRGAKMPTPAYAVNVPKAKVESSATALKTVGTVAVLLVCLIVTIEVQESVIDSRVEQYASCEVCANGGYSALAPSNTLDSFYAAICAGTDRVSLDVWQTQDGVLVVLSDSNLKQLVGVDSNVWELTYDQIKDLNYASVFGPTFADTHICTLEQVLDLCAGTVGVCVRIEPDGHGEGTEEKVAALLDAKGMTAQSIVSSSNLVVLEKTKAVQPALRTMYELQVAYGNISDIDHADIYNVEQAFVTPDMVDEVHAAGKYLSTGLVNNPSVMALLIGYNVDVLVTDDIPTARELTA